MMNPRRPLRRQAKDRRGATTVEFALTLPILLLFFFAQIEFSRANMVRHALVTASFEGCRTAIVLGATSADVEAAAQKTLDDVGLNQYTVTVTPNVITKSTEFVTVQVSAPIAGNSWIAPIFLSGTVLEHEMTMEREQHDQLIF